MASNAENVCIWWRHHVFLGLHVLTSHPPLHFRHFLSLWFIPITIKKTRLLHTVFEVEYFLLNIFSLRMLPQWEELIDKTWWRHQMETFSALLALCAGNSPVTGEFPVQRPMTRSFDIFFDLRLNKQLSKQSGGWWFDTPSRSIWHLLGYKTCLDTNPV